MTTVTPTYEHVSIAWNGRLKSHREQTLKEIEAIREGEDIVYLAEFGIQHLATLEFERLPKELQVDLRTFEDVLIMEWELKQ